MDVSRFESFVLRFVLDRIIIFRGERIEWFCAFYFLLSGAMRSRARRSPEPQRMDDFSAQMSPLLSFLVLTSSPLISFFRFNNDDDIMNNINNRLKKNNARISTTKRT